MLVEEKQMVDGDGILILDPIHGLGHQTAGAFQRLGTRMAGIFERSGASAESSTKPGQQAPYSVPMQRFEVDPQNDATLWEALAKIKVASVLVTPEPWLSRNQVLPALELERLRKIVSRTFENAPNIHAIVVLPVATANDEVAKFFECAARVTVLLVPALFGFRDASLMDRAVKLLSQRPSQLLKTADTSSLPLLASSDLAGLLISVPQRSQLFGKVLKVPASLSSVEEFRAAFAKAFEPRASNQISRVLSGLLASVFESLSSQKKNELAAGLNFGVAAEHGPLAVENALDYLPSALSKPERIFAQSRSSLDRHPTLELHFPPGRAP